MNISVTRAGVDGGMIAVAVTWLMGIAPHLAWIVPTVYYGVQLWIVVADRWFTKKKPFTQGYDRGAADNQAATDQKPQENK